MIAGCTTTKTETKKDHFFENNKSELILGFSDEQIEFQNKLKELEEQVKPQFIENRIAELNERIDAANKKIEEVNQDLEAFKLTKEGELQEIEQKQQDIIAKELEKKDALPQAEELSKLNEAETQIQQGIDPFDGGELTPFEADVYKDYVANKIKHIQCVQKEYLNIIDGNLLKLRNDLEKNKLEIQKTITEKTKQTTYAVDGQNKIIIACNEEILEYTKPVEEGLEDEENSMTDEEVDAENSEATEDAGEYTETTEDASEYTESTEENVESSNATEDAGQYSDSTESASEGTYSSDDTDNSECDENNNSVDECGFNEETGSFVEPNCSDKTE
jgi:hypothetical protein